MNKPIRLGVVGCGVRAEYHLLPLPSRELIEVTALGDSDYRQRQALADMLRPHNDGRGFIVGETLEAILPDVDAVFITTPDHPHVKQIVSAIKAGKHVLAHRLFAVDKVALALLEEATEYAQVHHLYFLTCHPEGDAITRFAKVIHGEIRPYISFKGMLLGAQQSRDSDIDSMHHEF